MAKKMPIFAIVVCFMMMLPSPANAFWLDIIKVVAKGVINIVQDATNSSSTNKIKTSSKQVSDPAVAPATEPTEQELLAAFDSLSRYCKKFSEQGFPCGMHSGKSTLSISNAMEIANTRADGELAKAVKQFVNTKATDVLAQFEDDDGNFSESTEFKRTLEVAASQEISGAQTYLTHSRTIKNAKGKDVYEVVVVRVLDANLFEKALTESAQNKPLSQSIIAETAKGFASKVKALLKKKI